MNSNNWGNQKLWFNYFGETGREKRGNKVKSLATITGSQYIIDKIIWYHCIIDLKLYITVNWYKTDQKSKLLKKQYRGKQEKNLKELKAVDSSEQN